MPTLTLRVNKAGFHEPGPPHWSGWRHDEMIVNHYVPGIERALGHVSGIRDAVAMALDTYRTLGIRKVAPTDPSRVIASQVSAQAVASNIALDQAALDRIVADIYGDAYLIGTHAAANVLGPGGGSVVFLSGLDQETNWDTWEPGHPEAALKAAQGGLAALLEARAITIKGIAGTTLDRLGEVIADGLAKGESTQAIYLEVRKFIDNPVRAMMVTRTETARAVVAAAFETYQQAGVAEWAWLAAPGACPICVQNSIGGPYPIGGGPEMPQHPACRCAPQGLPR